MVKSLLNLENKVYIVMKFDRSRTDDERAALLPLDDEFEDLEDALFLVFRDKKEAEDVARAKNMDMIVQRMQHDAHQLFTVGSDKEDHVYYVIAASDYPVSQNIFVHYLAASDPKDSLIKVEHINGGIRLLLQLYAPTVTKTCADYLSGKLQIDHYPLLRFFPEVCVVHEVLVR